MSAVEDSSVGAPQAQEEGISTAPSTVEVVEELVEEPPAEPYFWEEGGNGDVDWWAKVRHAVHFGGVKTIQGAEAIGEVVANTLGLTDSKYQYVIDALEADEYRRQREERDEEDRRQVHDIITTRKMELAQEGARSEASIELRDQHEQTNAGAVEVGYAGVMPPSKEEAKVTTYTQAGGGGGGSGIANAPTD